MGVEHGDAARAKVAPATAHTKKRGERSESKEMVDCFEGGAGEQKQGNHSIKEKHNIQFTYDMQGLEQEAWTEHFGDQNC